MHRRTKLILILLLIVVANAVVLCYSNRSIRQRIERWVRAVVRTQPERGFLFRTFVDAEGGEHRYVVFVPYEMQQGDRLPLMLFLNGFGKNGEDGVAPLYDGIAPVIWERRREFPFIVVFPQCREGETWEGSGPAASRALATTDLILEEFGADPERVYLTGLSSGGWGVWSIAAAHPERFAAIVPVSAAGVSREALREVAAAGTPVWSWHVRGDAEELVAANRDYQRSLLELGTSPCMTELDGTRDSRFNTHNAWDFAFRDGALYSWLLRQQRGTKSEADGFRLVELIEDDEGTVLSSGWRVSEGMLLSPIKKSGGASRFELGRWQTPLDLHVEFRPRGRCRLGIELRDSGSADGNQGVRLEIDCTPLGRGGVVDLANDGWIAANDVLAEASIHGGEWNDLRLRIDRRRLTATVNQWTLADCELQVEASAVVDVRLVVAGDDDGEADWRYLRTRPERSAMPEVAEETWNPHAVNQQRVDAIEVLRRRQNRVGSVVPVRMHVTEDRTGDRRWSTWRSACVATSLLQPRGFDCDLAEDRWHVEEWLPTSAVRRSPDGWFTTESLSSQYAQCIDRRSDPTVTNAVLVPVRTVSDERQHVEWVGFSNGRQHASRSQAQRRCAAGFGRMESLMQRAPLLAVNPLHPLAGFEASELGIAGTTMIAGTSCIVLATGDATGQAGIERSLCVDPQRGDLILRYVGRQGETIEQVDFDYERDAAEDWRLAGWTAVVQGDAPAGGDVYPGQSQRLELAAASVAEADPPLIRPDAAVVALAAGTIIIDEATGRWHEQMSGNELRELSPSEAAAMLSAADGINGTATWETGRRTWIIGGIAMLATLLIVLRRRRRGGENSGSGGQ